MRYSFLHFKLYKMKQENPMTLAIIVAIATIISICVVTPWDKENAPWWAITEYISTYGLSKDFVFWFSMLSAFVAFNMVASVSLGWMTRSPPVFWVLCGSAKIALLTTYASESFYNTAGVMSGIAQTCGIVLYGAFLFANGIKEKPNKNISPEIIKFWVVFLFGASVAWVWPWKEPMEGYIYDVFGVIGVMLTAISGLGMTMGLSFRTFNISMLIATTSVLISAMGQYNPGLVASNACLFLGMLLAILGGKTPDE